ncbi:MAG: hypothetical protein KGQ41_00960 [Alphaproteobacteria bacterium]|nr:hypothetical protein [Alphaproteobacteria bacterium]
MKLVLRHIPILAPVIGVVTGLVLPHAACIVALAFGILPPAVAANAQALGISPWVYLSHLCSAFS